MRLQFGSPVRRRSSQLPLGSCAYSLPPSEGGSGGGGALYAPDPSYLPAARVPSPSRAQRSLFAAGGGGGGGGGATWSDLERAVVGLGAHAAVELGGGASDWEHAVVDWEHPADKSATGMQAADPEADPDHHATPLRPRPPSPPLPPPGRRPPSPSAPGSPDRSASPPSAWGPYSPAVAPPSPGVVIVMPL